MARVVASALVFAVPATLLLTMRQEHVTSVYRLATVMVLLLLSAPLFWAQPTDDTRTTERDSRRRSISSLLAAGLARWRASWRAAQSGEDAWTTEFEGLHGAGMGTSGAINEKRVVGARKATSLAPLLHASFGLDHYPNYLQRWNMHDIDKLEQQLEDQLASVRAQKVIAV
jgi:hypothetical protein